MAAGNNNQAHGFPLHLFFAALLIALSIPVNLAMDRLRLYYEHPVKLVFQLPFPKAIAAKYGVETNDNAIESVTLAGFFSDWDPNDEHFRMRQVSPTRWEIELPLDPGDNQYKFVVRMKDLEYPVIWCQDRTASRQVDDAFGGLNSVKTIPYVSRWKLFLNVLLLGSAGILILLWIAEPIIRRLLNLRISFRRKLLISVLGLSVFSSAVYILYNFHEERELTKDGLIDTMNIIHQFLVADGFRPSDLSNPTNTDAALLSLRRFFPDIRARIERGKFSNRKSIIGNIALIDPNGHLLFLEMRRENAVINHDFAVKMGMTVEELFEKVVFEPVIHQAFRDGAPARDPVFGIPGEAYIRNYKDTIPLWMEGWSTAMIPILDRNRVAGFYAVIVHSKFYGNWLWQILIFNLLLFPIVTLLVFIFFRRVGDLVTFRLRELAGGLREVQAGNLDHLLEIRTGDELEELSKAYNVMRTGLKETDRLRDEIMANTSHELRTPLTGIIGISENLADGTYGKLNPEQDMLMRTVSASARVLSEMVSNILDYSRMKAGRDSLTIERFHVRVPMEAAASLVRDSAARTGLQFKVSAPDRLPEVYGDPERVERILLNLLGNAVKFTREGSVELSAEETPEHVRIIVRDTGIGIPVSFQRTIFEPFRQADGSMRREFGGTGLGLSISQKLAELHGTRIEVQSEPGKGSAFFFELPLDPSAIPSYALPIPPEIENTAIPGFRISGARGLSMNAVRRGIPSGHGEIILVVDDETGNREMLRDRFVHTGYRVITAGNGTEAIDAVHREHPHLVLLDIMMPGTNGYDFLTAIRAIPEFNAIPVLLVSALDTREDRVYGLSLGASDYIVRPFDMDELLARVRIQLDRSLAARELEGLRNHLETLVQERTHELRASAEELEKTRARLEWLSVTDTDTGLFNRRHFEQKYEEEFKRAVRDKTSLSLLLIDIDDFRSVNRNLGHLAGDEAIRQAALVIQRNARRPGDCLARYGGEEFSLLLPNTPRDGALLIANAILADVRVSSFPVGGNDLRLTFSIGAACVQPFPDMSIPVLLDLADSALYTAKQNGRDRVHAR
jgi:diguanylate cyclase (GGDEF)-like protein